MSQIRRSVLRGLMLFPTAGRAAGPVNYALRFSEGGDRNLQKMWENGLDMPLPWVESGGFFRVKIPLLPLPRKKRMNSGSCSKDTVISWRAVA